MDHDRRHPLSTFCLALALVAGPLGAPALAQVTGPPRIIDGDSLKVQGTVIRLYGIDAPEQRDPDEREPVRHAVIGAGLDPGDPLRLDPPEQAVGRKGAERVTCAGRTRQRRRRSP